jgi:hypothetical protein
MVAAISPDPRLQFFANDGSFLVGGKLYTYAAGTTTPLATYTSSTGGTANTNPVILDSRGEASVWLGSSKYKFVLKNANDVEVWTQDNLQAGANVDGSNATGTWPISISGNAATSTLATTATYATTAGSVTGGAVSSINGAGLYGFTLTGGPITTSGTLTVTPPAPSTAGNYMVSDGTAWVSQAFAGGSQYRNQLFTASGSWTCPTGVTSVKATIIGGGAGGSATSGGTGGSGGVAIGVYTVTPGTVYTVTVGLGTVGVAYNTNSASAGSSSFASFASATGGNGTTSSGSVDGPAGTGTGGTLLNTGSGAGVTASGVYGTFRSYLFNTGNNNAGTVQTFSPTFSAANRGAGQGALDTGGVIGAGGTSGIVYLEWVGA